MTAVSALFGGNGMDDFAEQQFEITESEKFKNLAVLHRR
jgi:hypothetical protein